MSWTMQQIQNELTPLLDKRRTWTRVAEMLIFVDVENVWEGEYRSYTEWLEKLAEQVKVSTGYLWQILKAGRVYAKYQFRRDKTGKETPDLTISVESLNFCEKLGGGNDARTDEYVEQLLSGRISKKELKAEWDAARANKKDEGEK